MPAVGAVPSRDGTTAHNPAVGHSVDDRACAVTDRAYSLHFLISCAKPVLGPYYRQSRQTP